MNTTKPDSASAPVHRLVGQHYKSLNQISMNEINDQIIIRKMIVDGCVGQLYKSILADEVVVLQNMLEAAEIPCCTCGAIVEGPRKSYAVPTCFRCLPPPSLLNYVRLPNAPVHRAGEAGSGATHCWAYSGQAETP